MALALAGQYNVDLAPSSEGGNFNYTLPDGANITIIPAISGDNSYDLVTVKEGPVTAS